MDPRDRVICDLFSAIGFLEGVLMGFRHDLKDARREKLEGILKQSEEKTELIKGRWEGLIK